MNDVGDSRGGAWPDGIDLPSRSGDRFVNGREAGSAAQAREDSCAALASRKMLYHYKMIDSRSSAALDAAGTEAEDLVAPATGWLDRVGIAVSAFCLLQCLALPLTLMVAPMASWGLLSHETFHLVLLAVILPVSLLAFTLGFWRHRNRRMWLPGGMGLALLIVAAGLEQAHVLAPGWIAALTSLASLSLITGHLINLRSR